MLTAAITGAIAYILSLFGIKPGPYLAGVAIVVKIIIVAGGMLVAARIARRRKAAAAAANPAPVAAPTPDGPDATGAA